MMFCNNCGANLKDGEVFCPECGTKQEGVTPVRPARPVPPVTPQEPVNHIPVQQAPVNQIPYQQPPVNQAPVNQMPANQPFMNQQPNAAAPAFNQPFAAPAQPAAKPSFDIKGILDKVLGIVKKFAGNKKLLIPTAAVAVVLILCIVFIPMLASAGQAKTLLSEENSVLYVSDGELCIANLNGKEKQELTKDFYLYNSSGVKFNVKSSRLFFPDKGDGDGYTLYYTDVSKKVEKRESVKVDSGIVNYAFAKNGKSVIYLKDNGTLYWNGLKDNKEKIASDVVNMYYIAESDSVLYVVREEDDDEYTYALYTVNEKGKTTEIATELESGLKYATTDEDNTAFYKSFYYIKDDTLYIIANGKKASAVCALPDMDDDQYLSIVYADDDKNVYFTIEGGEDNALYVSDYISDSYEAKDKTETKRPYKSDFDTTEEYEEALEEYNARNDRIDIRESIEDLQLTGIPSDTLYYTSGKDPVAIAQNVDNAYVSNDHIIVVQAAIGDAKVDIMDLVEEGITYGSSIRSYVENALYTEKTFNLVQKDKMLAITSITADDAEDMETTLAGYSLSISVDPDGKNLYYITERDDNNCGDLYTHKISSKVGNAEMLYSDVSVLYFDGKGNVVTLRDTDYDDGVYISDLYVKDKKIDTDVCHGFFKFEEDDTAILYLSNYSESDETYTLRLYNGKKAETVADEVNGAAILIDGKDTAYITNYSESSNDGDLCYRKGKKEVKLAGDVSAIVTPICY